MRGDRLASTSSATSEEFDVKPGGQRLGELLVGRKAITRGQVIEALLQQHASGKRIGELLVELGALDERSLAEAIAQKHGIPLIDLRSQAPDPEAVALLPEAFARACTAIPVRRDGDSVEVAVTDPSEYIYETVKEAIGGTPVTLVMAPGAEIRRAIENSYRALAGIERHVEAFQAGAPLRRATSVLQSAVNEDAPVVRIVNLVITQGLRDRASDIHLEPQESRVRVRYRIDGALHDVLALPESMGPAIASRVKIMAGMNIVERRKSQDGQIATEIEGRSLDIRVATTPTIWGEKVVMRLLDKSRPLFALEDLGMPANTHEAFSKLIRSPYGLVVCAGPTGSGKTTTLYATLQEINNSEINIMTIEDPVEYILSSINQIQINEQSGTSFAGGLRAILRQDPDAILVGEIRDTETAQITVRSALTGHFVLSSLHATDAASAIHRLLDMGIEPFLVASSLLAVVAQRLVRRICPYCRAEYEPTADELAYYAQQGGAPKDTFFHGQGCNLCAGSGYQDRIGVYEVMRVTERVKELIMTGGSRDQMRDAAMESGMRPLVDEGMRLVSEDITTIAEVGRSIYML